MPRFVANDAWVAPLVYSYNLNGQTITVGSATGNIDNATLPSAKNRNINIAGINQNYRGELMSSGALYDASFFKMTNISMGYNLKLPVYPIKAKITFGISNVFCITKYPGYDPEAASYVSSTTRKGIDIGSYPTQRSYNCSLSLMF